jgi:hypothetical protein
MVLVCEKLYPDSDVTIFNDERCTLFYIIDRDALLIRPRCLVFNGTGKGGILITLVLGIVLIHLDRINIELG